MINVQLRIAGATLDDADEVTAADILEQIDSLAADEAAVEQTIEWLSGRA